MSAAATTADPTGSTAVDPTGSTAVDPTGSSTPQDVGGEGENHEDTPEVEVVTATTVNYLVAAQLQLVLYSSFFFFLSSHL